MYNNYSLTNGDTQDDFKTGYGLPGPYPRYHNCDKRVTLWHVEPLIIFEEVGCEFISRQLFITMKWFFFFKHFLRLIIITPWVFCFFFILILFYEWCPADLMFLHYDYLITKF